MSQSKTVCVLTDEAIYAAVVSSQRKGTHIKARAEYPYRVPDTLLVDFHSNELAAAITEATQQVDGRSEALTLVIPLQWCFAQSLDISGKRKSPEELAYALEPYVPLALEELTCAFQSIDDRKTLGVAIPTSPMAELLAALAGREIDVARVVVDGFIYLEAWDLEPNEGVMIFDVRWCRLVSRHNDGVSTALCHPSALASRVNDQQADNNSACHWRICQFADGADETLRKLGTRLGSPQILSRVQSMETIAMAASAAVSPLDLRTGSLAHGGRGAKIRALAEQCLGALVILALVLVAGFHMKTRVLQKNLAAVEERHLTVYNRVFKDDALSPGAALRLASERIRLEALTRKSGTMDKDAPDGAGGPLDLLRNMAEKLPTDVRIMLSDARFDERQLLFRGQTVEHRDAERIVEAINQVSGVSARPPRTSRLPTGGVEFSITAMVGDDR